MADIITAREAAEFFVDPSEVESERLFLINVWMRKMLDAADANEIPISKFRPYGKNVFPGGRESLALPEQRLVHIEDLKRWAAERKYRLYFPAHPWRLEWDAAGRQGKCELARRWIAEIQAATGKNRGGMAELARKLGVTTATITPYLKDEMGDAASPHSGAKRNRAALDPMVAIGKAIGRGRTASYKMKVDAGD